MDIVYRAFLFPKAMQYSQEGQQDTQSTNQEAAQTFQGISGYDTTNPEEPLQVTKQYQENTNYRNLIPIKIYKTAKMLMISLAETL